MSENELIEKVSCDPKMFFINLNLMLEKDYSVKIEYKNDQIDINGSDQSSTLYFMYFTNFQETKESLNSLIEKLTEYNINLNDYMYKCV